MTSSEQAGPIKVGDTVAVRREILHRRGWHVSDLLHARGVVTGLVPLPCTVHLRVAWDRPGLPTDFGPQELCRIAAKHQPSA